MKDSSNPITGLSGDFVSQDDEGLFAFIGALRVSVGERVAADQERGLSLTEIVVQVREMVRLAGEDAHRSKPFPPRTIRAISRQAVEWCIQSYRPLLFAARNDSARSAALRDPLASPPVLAPTGASVRFPAQSPTYRGIP
jgi:hypothetical protein